MQASKKINKTEERSFDAWGRLRNPTNWTYTSVPAMSLTNRGFTGHEHLPTYGIINMNGRVYDPVLARFLSADDKNIVPKSTQHFNRYSYVLNNPLKYTDPSGWNEEMTVYVDGQKVDNNRGMLNWLKADYKKYLAQVNASTFTVNLVNAVKSANINGKNVSLPVLSKSELSKIKKSITEIYNKNGFLVNFRDLSNVKDLSKVDLSGRNTFVKLVDGSLSLPYGLTSYKVFDSDKIDTDNTFVNINRFLNDYQPNRLLEENINDKVLYGIGFGVSHEIAHQLIRKADIFTNGAACFSSNSNPCGNFDCSMVHDDSPINLNTDYSLGLFNYPTSSSSNFNLGEKLKSFHRNVINEFLKAMPR